MGKDCQCTGRSRNCSCGAKGKEDSKEKHLMKTELKPKSRLEMISYETNPRQSKRIDMIKTEDKRDVRVPVNYYKKKAKK